MKKFVQLFCLLLVCILLTACASSVPSLREQGVSLIAMLDELAASEEAIQIYSASPEINEIISNAATTHGQPKAVFAITIPDTHAEIPSGVSEALRSFLAHRTLSALPSQLNASAGAVTLAASAICTVSKTFIAKDARDVIYLYIYEDAVPAAVIFTAGENDTVSASATYILDDRHNFTSIEDIQALFGDLNVKAEPVLE